MTNNTNNSDTTHPQVTEETILEWCRNYGNPEAEGLQKEFNKRFGLMLSWLRRRVGSDAEGSAAWLWIYIADHPETFARRFNAHGWAGIVGKIKKLLNEEWPDLRHHEHEVPWGLIGSDEWIEEA